MWTSIEKASCSPGRGLYGRRFSRKQTNCGEGCVADPSHFGTDPDPRILLLSSSTFKTPTKKLFKKSFSGKNSHAGQEREG
jgi:hypothetical protein